MKIGNKDRKLKFGMNQSILYCEIRDISLTQMNKELTKITDGTGSELRDLIWSALKDGARVSKEKFEYSNFDVGDWLEELDSKEIESALNMLIESMPSKKKIPTTK